MSDPVPMLLFCPMCGARHIDDGEFATKPHHTHACQNMKCGMVWRPAIVPTVGVSWLPGFNNAISKLDAWKDQQEKPVAPPTTITLPAAEGAQLGVLNELAAERRAQIRQWGGAEHDDEHDLTDWTDFVNKQLKRAEKSAKGIKSGTAGVNDGTNFRTAMIKIGAIAVAAIESYDRKAKR